MLPSALAPAHESYVVSTLRRFVWAFFFKENSVVTVMRRAGLRGWFLKEIGTWQD